MNKAKMTNREIAAYYLSKAVEEDQKKIDAFCKTCFTEKMMNDLGSFTISEFKEAGKIVSSVLVRTLSKVHENCDEMKDDSERKSTRGRKPAVVNNEQPATEPEQVEVTEQVDQTVSEVAQPPYSEAGYSDSQYSMNLNNPNIQTGGVIYEQN